MIREVLRDGLDRLNDPLAAEVDSDLTRLLEQLNDLCVRKCHIGLLSLQSAGKTTLLNALLGYPLLPTTLVKGTVLPVSVEWGAPSIKLVTVDHKQRRHEVDPTAAVTPEINRALLDYACLCVNEGVVVPENLLYFHKDYVPEKAWSPEDIDLPQNDASLLMLLLILLNAHVEAETCKTRIKSERVRRARNELLCALGLSEEGMVGLSLCWDNDLLRSGICLHDFPGLDSGSAYIRAQGSLDDIAVSNAEQMDILLCIVTPEVVIGEMAVRLQNIIKKRGQSLIPVLVVNMADRVDNGEIALTGVREMLANGASAASYMISARSAEYMYVTAGIPVDRTELWRKVYLPWRMQYAPEAVSTENESRHVQDMIERDYLKTYPAMDSHGKRFCASTHDFIVSIMPALQDEWLTSLVPQCLARHKQGARLLQKIVSREAVHLAQAIDQDAIFWQYLRDRLSHGCMDIQSGYEDSIRQLKNAANSLWDDYEQGRSRCLGSISILCERFTERATEIVKGVGGFLGIAMFHRNADQQNALDEDDALSHLHRLCLELPEVEGVQETFIHYRKSLYAFVAFCEHCLKQVASMEAQFDAFLASTASAALEHAQSREFTDIYRRYAEASVRECTGNISGFFSSVRDLNFGYVPINDAPPLPDLRQHLIHYLTACIKKATLVDHTGSNQKQTLIISRRRLLKALRSPAICPETTDKLLNAHMPASLIEAVCKNCENIQWYSEMGIQHIHMLLMRGIHDHDDAQYEALERMKHDSSQLDMLKKIFKVK